MTYATAGASIFGGGGSGVITHMIALGAMDAYLIKGASVTFFRFRYARHTNFALEAVGQAFQNQPQFGGTSQIILNRTGDLIYYIYVVIDLPGIRACRPGQEADPLDLDDTQCEFSGRMSQFPSMKRNDTGGPTCIPCNDNNYFAQLGQCYNSVDADEAVKLGKYDWKLRNYGGCYNPELDESETSSLPASVDENGNTRAWCHWANAIGQLLIKRARLVVGGHETDTLYSDYLYMWEELSGKAGKRLKEMIGKRKSRKQLIKDAREAQRLYVPLPFWFTQTSGNALPLCTLQFHGVQIHIEWEQLRKCVIVSHDDVKVLKCVDGAPLTNNDLMAWLDTTYVYLDIEERNRFSLANFDQLITQVQVAAVTQKGGDVNIPIRFNHPIIELIWAVRRKCNENTNNHFNFSGLDGRDPIDDVSLRLNNLFRFSGREGRYYRLVQPYQHHSSIPKAHIYNYSFALYPEEPQPSGSCNMSRIDNVDMNFKLQDGLEKEYVTVLVFGRNWNIMRFTEGLGGTLFNN